MSGTTEWILAHQGGWDELLMFGAPILLAIVAVRWAERRGRKRREAATTDEMEPAGGPDDAPR